MVPRLDLRVTKWQEHCPGSTVVKYNHPSGRTSYVYVSATGETITSWRDSLFHMMSILNTSNSHSKLERGPFQAMLSTAKRLYRARVWEEKGGKVVNNTYRRDNIPNGQLCVLYVSPEGRRFRSWKQCVRYMGEDPLASVSWKHLSSNGEETHPSAGGENYNLQSAEVEACAWELVGNTKPSSPQEKGSLLSGDRSLVQKTQTLNVISSSSSSGESDCRKILPLPSKQAIISISSSKELGNEKGGSSSSEKSISPASSSSAYGNGDFSSSSSEDLDDAEDSEMNMVKGLIHLHSGPSQDSVEKSDTELVRPEPPAPREEDLTSGNREVITRKPLRIPRLLNNDFMELEKDAANTSPPPIILPPKSVLEAVIRHAHTGVEPASPAREAVCAGKKSIFTEVIELPTDMNLEYDKKRKICVGEGGVEQEEEEEGRQSLKTKTKTARDAVAEEPITSRERSRSSRGKATFQATKPPEDEPESHGDHSSDESITSLKDLMWKVFEEAMKRREFSTSPSKKKPRKESHKRRTTESNCCCQGSTIIVVRPCRIRNYHK